MRTGYSPLNRPGYFDCTPTYFDCTMCSKLQAGPYTKTHISSFSRAIPTGYSSSKLLIFSKLNIVKQFIYKIIAKFLINNESKILLVYVLH